MLGQVAKQREGQQVDCCVLKNVVNIYVELGLYETGMPPLLLAHSSRMTEWQVVVTVRCYCHSYLFGWFLLAAHMSAFLLIITTSLSCGSVLL